MKVIGIIITMVVIIVFIHYINSIETYMLFNVRYWFCVGLPDTEDQSFDFWFIPITRGAH